MRFFCIVCAPLIITWCAFPAARVSSSSEHVVPELSRLPTQSFRYVSSSPRKPVCREVPIGMTSEEFTVYTFSDQRIKEEKRRGESVVVARTKAQHILLLGGDPEIRTKILATLKMGLQDSAMQRSIIKGKKSGIKHKDLIHRLKHLSAPKVEALPGASGKNRQMKEPLVSVLEICTERFVQQADHLTKGAGISGVHVKKGRVDPWDITFTRYNCEVIDFKNGYLMIPGLRETVKKFHEFEDTEIIQGNEQDALTTLIDQMPNLKAMLCVDEEDDLQGSAMV